MGAHLLHLLNSLCDETSPPSREGLLALIQEIVGFVRDLKARLDSKDPKQREEAEEMAFGMKRVLESKLGALADQMGIDPSQLIPLMEGFGDESLVDQLKEGLNETQRSGKPPRSYKQIIR